MYTFYIDSRVFKQIKKLKINQNLFSTLNKMFHLNKINKLEKTVSLDSARQPFFNFTRKLQEIENENTLIKAENVEIKLQNKILLEKLKDDSVIDDKSRYLMNQSGFKKINFNSDILVEEETGEEKIEI